VSQLACRTCGRRIFSVGPIEGLFLEERRCPRCGATLEADRRLTGRRQGPRRQNPPDDPGPPPEGERRKLADRRKGQRRREG